MNPLGPLGAPLITMGARAREFAEGGGPSVRTPLRIGSSEDGRSVHLVISPAWVIAICAILGVLYAALSFAFAPSSTVLTQANHGAMISHLQTDFGKEDQKLDSIQQRLTRIEQEVQDLDERRQNKRGD